MQGAQRKVESVELDFRYNPGYTLAMKTAISIPDALFRAADKVAKQLSISRSELYSKAVRDFLAAHPPDDVTKTLDEVYSENPSRLDPAVEQMQGMSLENDPW